MDSFILIRGLAKTLVRWAVALGFLLLGVCPASAEPPVDFLREVQPLLAEHCFECHGEETEESGLRLDLGHSILEGGYSGPAIVAGKSEESLLIKAMRGDDEEIARMPPEGAGLTPAQIELLKRWIDEGATVPNETMPEETKANRKRRSSDHWSFQPLGQVEPPQFENQPGILNPVDAFVLARLQAAGLEPSPEAAKATLIRRVSLDLIGLPPTLEEVDAFLEDEKEGAYERLVDRLLHSPHYGERWGRHWLDVARYADSDGYTIDARRSIWKYRDWVIEAINRDLPFDQFVIEQIAGDLLPAARIDQIIATGFHRNTLVNAEGGTDDEQFRVEAVVDRVSTTGAAFLGLTLGCARCHDHKFDPISQKEFYQLFAIFDQCDEPTMPLPTAKQAQDLKVVQVDLKQWESKLAQIDANSAGRQAEWEKQQAAQPDPKSEGDGESTESADAKSSELTASAREAIAIAKDQRTEHQQKLIREAFLLVDPERGPMVTEIAKLKSRRTSINNDVITTLVMRKRKEPRTTHIHLRGSFLAHGVAVNSNVPEVLPPLESRNEQPDRLDFARWLVNTENPLTSRVTVNRIWQRYFGRGLVATENDFGLQGDLPSHPELLDWLSTQLIDSGWSMKSLHRLIVTSATYRQSSRTREDLLSTDPYNRLLGRQQRLRLQAETIRDVALASSGLLAPQVGGPSVFPPQPEGIYLFTQVKREWKEAQDDDRYRRGMYICLQRSSPYPFLKTFDASDATVTCTRRPRSNTPLQALTLANDVAFFEIAQGLAMSLLAESLADDEQRIRYAFRRCLSREPSTEEFMRLSEYLQAQQQYFAESPEAAASVASVDRPKEIEVSSAAAWTLLSRVMLNLDEFITRE